MIVRLVKMEFEEDQIESFRSVFNSAQPKIEKMVGCFGLSLHQDINQPTVFFTISKWNDEESLDNYRQSDLFINTWRKVKPMFSKKAEAWSLK
jgi:quinol monooxygenase YgiN